MNEKKTKLTLVIGEKLDRRLDLEAAISGKGHDRSSIVEDLINTHISLPEAVDAILTEPAEAKASGRQPTEDGTRGKTTFYLSPSTARRLQLHATWTGEDRSDAVERLIREWITPWNVYDPRTHNAPAVKTNRQRKVTESSEENREAAQVA